MSNERLRNAIAAAGLTIEDVAGHVGVDRKTVERWIANDRLPHRRHRYGARKLLRLDETYLWPAALSDSHLRSAAEAELITLYPHRGAVPRDLWLALVDRARVNIDILVYAGLFLWDGYP